MGLARLARADFPVPPAFCITTVGHQSWLDQDRRMEPVLSEEILAAFTRLKNANVAVRSSLTMEDGIATSLAGLASTRIGTMNESALLQAVGQIWTDLENGRAHEHLKQLGLANASLDAAIVVQVLIPADVAGVLMTRDPADLDQPHMIVEAAWGLGESTVSGKVIPDYFRLDSTTGGIVEEQIGFKSTRQTVMALEDVPEQLQRVACLSQAQLSELAKIGHAVEASFGFPCDVEWAFAANKLWLLQARPITTNNKAEQAAIRQQEIDLARARAAPRGTIWFRNAFASECVEPTPMTWSVLKKLFSATGGFGRMYRDLGFHPDQRLNESGSYDLICGRLYCNLSREPLFFASGLPLTYDFDTLRHIVFAMLEQARPRLDWRGVNARFWLGLPKHLYRSIVVPLRVKRAYQTFPRVFQSKVVSEFRTYLKHAETIAWNQLDEGKLRELLNDWIEATLIDFARDALKPGVLAGQLELSLMDRLTKELSAEKARAALVEMVGSVPLDPEVDLPASCRALAAGTIDRQTFFERFGHRGSNEWELAKPRWAEDPGNVADLIRSGGGVSKQEVGSTRVPVPPAIKDQVATLRHMLALRELARHYLLKGFSIIRRILLALDQLLGLQGGIFYLELEDLGGRVPRSELRMQSRQTRRRRRQALGLPMPAVLFSDDLEAIGRPAQVEVSAEQTLHGTPLSPGVAEGIAFVPKDSQHDQPPAGPFILVCACTDPAWISLAAQASALVTETGGFLSHGAILARELALPAVGGIAGACKKLAGGVHVRVDGARGLVTISSST